MAQLIEGIELQENENGEITFVTIDMQKHGNLIKPVLEQLGAVRKPGFQEECARGITVEEARQRSLDALNKLWKK